MYDVCEGLAIVLKYCKIVYPDQGRIKSLRGPRPVFSAGPQSTEKCGGCGCVLDTLLFM
jgi:hypothetical protein